MHAGKALGILPTFLASTAVLAANMQNGPYQLKDFKRRLESRETFPEIWLPLIMLNSQNSSQRKNHLTPMTTTNTSRLFNQDGSVNGTWFKSYHHFHEHFQWLNDLHRAYPKNTKIGMLDSNAIGMLDPNAISFLHIFGGSGGGKKPAVVFTGNIHAREWISSMVVEYMAYELTSKYGRDANITSLVDQYDFYLLPIVNPLGFIFSQGDNFHTDFRLWRKNRQDIPGSDCVGQDINRNFPYQWGPESETDNPCGEDFRGMQAGDAAETKALIEFLSGIQGGQGIKLFIDYHSYGGYILTPYVYDCNVQARNNDKLLSIAKGAADAIYSVHNTSFKSGPACSTLYPASGTLLDYVADVIHVDYSFVFELRGNGRYGFLLPRDEILPSGEETFAGVRYILQNIK